MFDQFSYRGTDVYNDEQCQDIINKYDSVTTHRMQQGKNGEKSNNRDVFIERIDPRNHLDLAEILFDANKIIYKFDVERNIECYFARYETGNHYNAVHTDCTIIESEDSLQRKLSFSLFLNDDYEGGELNISNNDVEKTRGSLIVFPSFIPHSVKPVTAGTRYVIFGFLLGPIWR